MANKEFKDYTAVANYAGLASTDIFAIQTDVAGLRTVKKISKAQLDAGIQGLIAATNLSGLAASTSAHLAGILSDETGTGVVVFNTSPTIVTPTIASFVNATHTHLNAAGGGTLDAAAIGSGVIAIARLATGTPTGSKFIRDDGVLAVPAGGGGGSTPTGTGFYHVTGGVMDTAAITETGTGSVVLATSPTLVTPVLGVASATSIDIGNADTTVSRSAAGVLAVEGVAVPTISSTHTLTNKTLTTPTIASFTNATHDHSNAAGGGTLNASAIAAGTMATARLGSGSASSSTYLRGDQTWAAVSGSITGADTRVVFFDGTDTPAGDAGLTYNKTTDVLTAAGGFVSGASTAGTLTIGDGATHTAIITTPTITTSYTIVLPTSQGVTGFLLGTVSSTTITLSQVAATGSGSVVCATSPTLVTPVLGVATATSINKVAITAPATSATLTIADGKTVTVNNTLTIAGTDSTTITLPAVTASVLSSAGGEINALTSKASPTTSDLLIIEDAAASNAKKKITIGSLPGGGSATTYSSHAGTGNATTVETTIFTQSITASTLAADGDTLRGEVWITCAANANTKELKLKLGSTTLADFTHSYNAAKVWLKFVIMRGASATSQFVGVTAVSDGGNNDTIPNGTASENLGNTLTLSITATGVANNDIVGNFWKVVKE